MLAVLFYLACTGLFLTLSLAGPVFVGLLIGETEVSIRLGFYLLLGSFLFGGPALAIYGRQRKIPTIGRLWLLALVWSVLPLMAAMPIYDISELGVIDSLFEAVSGLTTTGASTLNTVEVWPRAMVFFRVQLQWIGGFLALLTVILIMAPAGIGGLSSQRTALTSGADLRGGQDRLAVFVINLALLYATLTAFCFLAFFLSGTRAYYAVTLAMTATSTGGFMPFDGSLDSILGTFGLLVFGTFLLLGATSIFWHKMFVDRNLRALKAHRESYSVLILTAVLAFVFSSAAVRLAGGLDEDPLKTFVTAFMNAASLVATSGVQSQPGYMTLLPLVAVIFVIFLGGSAFSTSGGLKHYRLGGMLVQSWRELDRLVYPNSVHSTRFGSQEYDMNLMKAIWSFFVVAILTIGFGTIMVATSRVPFEAAFTAAVAAFSTAGPVYTAGWSFAGGEPWPPYSDLSGLAKIALMIVMLLGRLEVLAVIGLFSARYWRSR